MSGGNPNYPNQPQGFNPYYSQQYYPGQYPVAYQYQQQQGFPQGVQMMGVPNYGPAGAPPYAEAPPPYTEQAPAQPQAAGIQQPVHFEGAFDYRARFDGIAQPCVPPPPPGIAPNQAQIASMQGHQVTATQQHRDIFW